VNEEPEQIAEAIKDSSPRQEIRADTHLTRNAKENTVLVLVEKFLGGPKNNQLLNAIGGERVFDSLMCSC
jgi:hypothetical protein